MEGTIRCNDKLKILGCLRGQIDLIHPALLPFTQALNNVTICYFLIITQCVKINLEPQQYCLKEREILV